MNKPILSLVGMPWAGKSTLGEALAQHLKVDFLDVDRYLEKQQGLGLTQIVSKYGELAFRQMEWELMKKMAIGFRGVIATGGGFVETDGAMDQWVNMSNTIYLKVDISILQNRMLKTPPSRIWELGLSQDERALALEQRYLRRIPEFQKAHEVVQIVDNWDTDLIALTRVAEINNF